MTPPPVTRGRIARFMCLSVVSGMSAGMSQLLLVLYAVTQGASASRIGLISGMHGLGLLVMVLPVGILIDHVGPRKVFVFGASAMAVVYLMFPLAGSFPLICLFAGFVGFFTAFRFIPLSSVVIDYVRSAGSDKAGFLRGANSLGVVLLGPLLGAFFSRQAGFRNTFLILSGIALLLVAGAMASLPDRRGGDAAPASGRLRSLAALFVNGSLLRASLAEALGGATQACFNVFSVVVAIRVFGFPAQSASMLVSLQGVVFIASLFTLSRILDRLGERNATLIGAGIIVAGLLSLSSHLHPVFLVAGGVGIGVGLGMFSLLNITRIARAGAARGGSAGMFALFAVTGSTIGPIVGGFVGQRFGLSWAFLFFVPLYLLLVTVLVSRRWRSAKGVGKLACEQA